jgi:hypothetical protein
VAALTMAKHYTREELKQFKRNLYAVGNRVGGHVVATVHVEQIVRVIDMADDLQILAETNVNANIAREAWLRDEINMRDEEIERLKQALAEHEEQEV